MRRVLVALTALVVAGMLWGSARPAAAGGCVYDEREVIKSSRVIVEGRVTGWSTGEGRSSFDSGGFPWPFGQARGGPEIASVGVVPPRVQMLVEKVHEGSAPPGLDILGCGGFGFVPTNQYVIVALSENDGEHRASRASWLFVGDDPGGENYDAALERIESGPGSPFPWLSVAIAAVLGPVAFLAGGAFVWGRKGGAG